MKTASVQQMQALDRLAIEEYGIPSLVLMENAGRAVAEAILKIVGATPLCLPAGRQGRPSNKGRHGGLPLQVCVVCGRGNNAGDGFVAARHLLNAGIRTKIFLIGQESDLKNDAAVNYQILKKCSYPIEIGSVVPGQQLSRVNIVVDAIFGVGLNRPIEEPFKTVIETINSEAKYVISVDTPSGLDGTTGKIYGVCVQADLTVTFGLAKKGFFKNAGPAHTGKIVIADIGIPRKIINKM